MDGKSLKNTVTDYNNTEQNFINCVSAFSHQRGLASLNGDLNISLVNGYTPTVGDTFNILTLGDRTGNLTAINAPNLGNGLGWDTIRQGDQLRWHFVIV